MNREQKLSAHSKFVSALPQPEDATSHKDAFIRRRRQGIGASSAASILQVPGAYCTPHEEYLRIREGIDIDLSDNEAVLTGQMLEKFIGERYSMITGRRLFTPSAQPHKDYPWMVATGDFQTTDKLIMVEAKSVCFPKKGEWCNPNEYDKDCTETLGVDSVMPNKFMIQAAVQAACYGVNRVDVPSFQFGRTVKIYSYIRSPELESAIFEKCEKFWFDHVIPGNPPPPTINDDLTSYFDCAKGTARELTQEQYEIVQSLKQIKAEIRKLEKAESHYSYVVKASLFKEFDTLTKDSIVVATWKESKRRDIDVEELKKEEKNIAKKYTKTSTIRRLTIK